MDDELQDNVKALLELGYMPDAIYYDQVAKGHTLYSIVNVAADIDVHREPEFRYLGELIAQNPLPRTACGGHYQTGTSAGAGPPESGR